MYYRALALALLLSAGCGDDDGGNHAQPPPQQLAWTVATDTVGDALMVTPHTALEGKSMYAVIATTAIRTAGGQPVSPSADFAAAIGVAQPGANAATALYSANLGSADNPYPDARLVRDDGTVRIPDRYLLRGLPTSAAAELPRQILRRGADRLETLDGYSTTGPIRIALSESADLSTVDASSLFLVKRADGGTDLAGLIAIAGSLGIADDEIAIAFSFPTQSIEDDLVAVQALLRDRAGNGGELVDIVDRDPDDDLELGVFDRDDDQYAAFLDDSPDVDRVVSGLVASPDFRDDDGVWVASRVRGESPAPENDLHFLLTLPRNAAPPYPVVLVQHGFGGDNGTVLGLGQLLAAEGLAAIGINAVSHGRRGSALDLLRARPFIARDIFRQTIADQMAVLRAIEAGVDVDDDGSVDLDAEQMSFIGISLGGLLGASLVAVEEILPTAVLNVAGGRIAFLGQTVGLRDLVQGELAEEVGLAQEDPVFQTYISRLLESGQHAMDPVDGLNYARRWFLEPFPGAEPHNVLLQEGIGDELVTNESTEALAAAGGLVANTEMDDPAGVSGLWRFEPPGGHGILARDDVRRQAAVFLASNGTRIIDPGS